MRKNNRFLKATFILIAIICLGGSVSMFGETQAQQTSFVYLPVISNGRAGVQLISSRLNDLPNGSSYLQQTSDDGRYTVFNSHSTDLIDPDHVGDIHANQNHVYVYDRDYDKTTLISYSPEVKNHHRFGRPHVSPDGQKVVFIRTSVISEGPDTSPTLFVFDINDNSIEKIPWPALSLSSISNDGIIVFQSVESNLVQGDTNNKSDIFTLDIFTQAISRISLSSKGDEANGNNRSPSISSDGNLIVFESDATNLATETLQGLYLHNRSSGETRAVPVDLAATNLEWYRLLRATISSDGKHVLINALVYDYDPVSSIKTNLQTLLALDLDTDQVKVIDVRSPAKSQSPLAYIEPSSMFISSAGRFITYHYGYEKQAYIYDQQNNQKIIIPRFIKNLSVSETTNTVTFESEYNGLLQTEVASTANIFDYHLVTKETKRITSRFTSYLKTGPGISDHPSISNNGEFMAFYSESFLLGDGPNIYLMSMETGETRSISSSIYDSLPFVYIKIDNFQDRRFSAPVISSNGEVVVYEVYGYLDEDATPSKRVGKLVFYNRISDKIHISDVTTSPPYIDRSPAPDYADLAHLAPLSISANGRFASFMSKDASGQSHVYVYDQVAGKAELISMGDDGSAANNESTYGAISGDGRFVAFYSSATNLVGTVNIGSETSLFVFDRESNQTTHVGLGAPWGGDGELYLWSPPSLSYDGRYIVFTARRQDYVSTLWQTNSVFIYDQSTGEIEPLNYPLSWKGDASNPKISSDGRYLVFVSETAPADIVSGPLVDNNASKDVFVFDRLVNKHILVSSDLKGFALSQGARNPAVSPDGKFVAFSALDADSFSNIDTNNSLDVYFSKWR